MLIYHYEILVNIVHLLDYGHIKPLSYLTPGADSGDAGRTSPRVYSAQYGGDSASGGCGVGTGRR